MGNSTAFVFMLAIVLAGCGTTRHSQPQRTATEQLLISTAAERAAQRLTVGLEPGTRVFVNADTFEAYDQRYALGAVRSRILESGARLMAARKDADVVVEVRAGALSLDQSEMLIGIPSMDLPIPLAGSLKTPEISLFKRQLERGIAKFSMIAYDSLTGGLKTSSGPVFGFSHRSRSTVLLFMSWRSDDILPESADD